MSVSAGISEGWAIRRNRTCLSGLEVDCGETVDNFHGCCPRNFECANPYNQICCSPGQNCTEPLVPQPNCANATWDLYDNGGYFCCEQGRQGLNRDATNLCALPGFRTEAGDQLLEVVKAGENITSSSSVSSSASSTSATSSATNISSPDKSSTPLGAIVGGVVGGIAAIALIALLAWFFLRRRKRPEIRPESPKEHDPFMKFQLEDTQVSRQPPLVEADSQAYAPPVATAYKHVQELPVDIQSPVELAGDTHLADFNTRRTN